MVINFLDQKIRRAFSDAAMQYDVLTSLHKEIGRELIKGIMAREQCDTILDLGMGTGKMTKKLSFYFPESHIVGLDCASGMIEYAKSQYQDFNIVQADAREMPLKSNSFDIIYSNLACQWISDLKTAFEHCFRVLADDGVFAMTVFGYHTFDELFKAFAHTFNEEITAEELPVGRLISIEELKRIMDGIEFKNVEFQSEKIKVRFEDMVSIIRWIKEIGANSLQRDIYIGKEYMDRANQYYNQTFSDRFGVYTTLEVIWVKAYK